MPVQPRGPRYCLRLPYFQVVKKIGRQNKIQVAQLHENIIYQYCLLQKLSVEIGRKYVTTCMVQQYLSHIFLKSKSVCYYYFIDNNSKKRDSFSLLFTKYTTYLLIRAAELAGQPARPAPVCTLPNGLCRTGRHDTRHE